jgi:hypothetical protein
MEVIKSLVDFKSRYDENGDPLCQACTRLGKYINVDLAELFLRFTGRNIPVDWNCCMFCKQHSKKIAKQLALLCVTKFICSGMGMSKITGIPSEYFTDWEAQYKIIDKVRKSGDGKTKKKKSTKSRTIS